MPLFPVREDEPDYAKLAPREAPEVNRYGKPIRLVDGPGESLKINGDAYIGPNPNRNKQHAFFFTADNCIGCHACEAACSEKNDLPPHLSFRSVGYVEGGSYPNFFRLNISMACNHCDDPVCLKGCPTRAYTKHPEYGAVIQDPDICFGCGYCTWVCPYNAPQLDPVKGRVEKCNMCVDRLEAGLKPACVSACVGNALDFGVVETVPEGREMAEVQIPGFPDPGITHPNIRFQLSRSLPPEFTRTDMQPVKYRRGEDGRYRSVVDQKQGKARHWSLRRLSSRENPLVLFTLMVQAAVGSTLMLALAALGASPALAGLAAPGPASALLAVAGALAAGGLFLSTTHLGKPWRFYRGFNNLRWSPVSREGLATVVFLFFAAVQGALWLPGHPWAAALGLALPAPSWLAGARAALAVLTALAGLAALYYMYRCYRIKARPFWDTPQTATAFLGNALALGALAAGAVAWAAAGWGPWLGPLAALLALGLAVEGLGLWWHARHLNTAGHEGSASHYIQCTTFGKTYLARNLLLGANTAAAAALAWIGPAAWPLGLFLAVTVPLAALVGRALFYVLVVPTTLPGAFFWRNKAFEQHARDIGLAANPAVGVPLHDH